MITRTRLDANNLHSWAERTGQFDDDGFLVGKIETFDDGRVLESTLQNGVLVSETAGDPLDNAKWTSWASTFNALTGKLETKSLILDDGRAVVTAFVDGIPTSRTVTDDGENYGWSSKTKLFDATGRLTSESKLDQFKRGYPAGM